ncbi:hypothetical protein LJG64_31965, partial [Pseudomonas aeruginosa]|nr:hypothetical protein [Pseudomonas aeruginosa]MCC0443003.1 hypothetical protein [Pseudomonas aeruginosa]
MLVGMVDRTVHESTKIGQRDGAWLDNGSFNGTRSAGVTKRENLLVTDAAVLIDA